jgi:hypothetical protein
MAEFREPPVWKPGDLVTSANLNIYSNNDLYFKEKIEYLESSVGVGVFRKVKEVVLTESNDVIDVTDIHLTKNKIYYCFLIGGIAPTTENSVRIYFNGDYDYTLYHTSYFLFKDYQLTANYEVGPYLSKAQHANPIFIPFKIIIVESAGLWTWVIIEKHKTGVYYYPWTFEGFIWYGRSSEIFSMRIEISPDTFLAGTKLTIWESAFI